MLTEELHLPHLQKYKKDNYENNSIIVILSLLSNKRTIFVNVNS